MMKPALLSRFKKTFGPLLWLAGLAVIIVYAPARYRALNLADGENVAGFLGNTHELVTVLDSNPAKAHRPSWLDREHATRFHHRTGGLAADGGTSLVSPLGHRVSLRNLDLDTNRLLPLEESLSIFAVSPCADGQRLCIEHGSLDQRFLSIVDASTGKEIRRVPTTAFWWNMSYDGRRLAYHDLRHEESKFICVDVNDGRLLYTEVVGANRGGFISPDGKCIAILKSHDSGVIDIEHKRQLIKTNSAWPLLFSPDSRRFGDLHGNIWDLGTNRIICGDVRDLDYVFVDRGRKIARPSLSGRRVRFLDLDTKEELISEAVLPELESDDSLHGPHPPRVETVDANGNFVRIWGPQADRQTFRKLYAVLEWFGYKRGLSGATPSNCWALIDARSGSLMHKGSGDLIAVSADGRYVISGDEEARHIKVQELPLGRSMLFIAIAGAAWTVLALIVRRWTCGSHHGK
jgi:hypothetical protein